MHKSFAHAHRTGARATAAVRRGKSLVQVDMHYIEAHVARTRYAEHRVEVGAIVVKKCPGIMHHTGNFRYLTFENAQSVGVCHHHRGNCVVEQWSESLHVDSAVRQTADGHHLKSGHGSRRGICAMSRIRYYHFRASAVAT